MYDSNYLNIKQSDLLLSILVHSSLILISNKTCIYMYAAPNKHVNIYTSAANVCIWATNTVARLNTCIHGDLQPCTQTENHIYLYTYCISPNTAMCKPLVLKEAAVSILYKYMKASRN